MLSQFIVREGGSKGRPGSGGKTTSEEEAGPHCPLLASWSWRGSLGWSVMLRASWDLTGGVAQERCFLGMEEIARPCVQDPLGTSSSTQSQTFLQTRPTSRDLRAVEAKARCPAWGTGQSGPCTSGVGFGGSCLTRKGRPGGC